MSALLTFYNTHRAYSCDIVIRGRSNCSDFQTSSDRLCLQNLFRFLHPSRCLQQHFFRQPCLDKNVLSGLIWSFSTTTKQLHQPSVEKYSRNVPMLMIFLAQSLLKQLRFYVFGNHLYLIQPWMCVVIKSKVVRLLKPKACLVKASVFTQLTKLR